MNRSVIKARTVWTLSLLFLLSIATPGFARFLVESDVEASSVGFDGGPRGALWLADSFGVRKVDSATGEPLLTIPVEATVRAVAVDEDRQRVWLYDGDSLAVHDFAGELLRRLEVAAEAKGSAALSVVSEDGSIWLAANQRLLGISFEGQILREIRLPEAITDLATDREHSLLWLAHGEAVSAYDVTTGLEVRTLRRPGTVVDLDVATGPDRLWLARADGLYRHDRGGHELFEAPVAGLTAVVGDDRGGLWLASGDRLQHLDVAGDQRAFTSPFGEDSTIDRLLFDAAHRAVWVLSGGQLAKLSASGEVLARSNLEPGAKVHAWALAAGSPDRVSPLLELRQETSKTGDSVLEIGFRDFASGVDSASLEMQADGESTGVFACTLGAHGGRCLATSPLSDGSEIEVLIRDHLGNPQRASLQWRGAGREPGGDPEVPAAGADDSGEPQNIVGRTASLAGERVPSLRGYVPNQPFLSDGEIEAINAASGNVNISIPLGQEYAVGPHLRYQLRVTHNSDAWAHSTVFCSNGGCAVPQTLVGIPQRGSNAGLGWELHLGQLYPPEKPDGLYELDAQTWPNQADDEFSTDANSWLYVSPGGTSHSLHTLPGRVNSSGGRPVRYSKDGSHLRMRQIDADTVIVEHPSGVISEFEQSNQSLGTLGCGGGVTGCWRFREQRDYYGNRFTVDYEATADGELWTLSDSTGRSHSIVFKTDDQSRRGNDASSDNKLRLGNGDELGDLLRVLDRVVVAASAGRQAEYKFEYLTKLVQRTTPHDPNGTLGSAARTMRVPVLKKIVVPETRPYRFTYYYGYLKSGRIKEITLPTLGKYAYDYRAWRFPTACIYTTTNDDVEADYDRYGISLKQHKIGNDVVATWNYSSSIHPTVANGDLYGPTCKRAQYRRTQIDSPTVDNRFTRRELFNAVTQGPQMPSASDPIGAWQITDHGLPFDKGQRIGTGDADYLFLSERVSDCVAGNCTAQREKYVRYAMERRPCTAQNQYRDAPGCWQVDPVLVRERTIFKDDADRWLERKNTYHTGAGQTQNAFTLDDFTGVVRTVEHRTEYTAGAGTARPESSTTGYINMGTPSTYLPGVSSRWILTPYSSKTLIDNGRTYVTSYRFDSGGVMDCMRKRRYAGIDHATDVVTKYVLGTDEGVNAGLAVQEIRAGGSNGGLGGDVCNVDGTSGTNKFTFNHGYQSLVRSSTQIGDFPYRYRADIDRNTGLPVETFNPSDQGTIFVYDLLGRTTRVAPVDGQGEADTWLTYHSPSDVPPSVTIERKVGNDVFSSGLLVYDHFGRLRREIQSIPTSETTSAESEQETKYDVLGRVTAVSTVQQKSHVNSDQNATRYAGYDPFGRPSLITRPDGTQEVRAYQGVRLSTSTVNIQTETDGTSAETTTSISDGLGRQVHRYHDEYEEIFRYDPHGNVVESERRPRGEVLGQKRQFGWDNRELLIWEKHPEIGSTASNGTISFFPDVLGNTLSHFDGQHRLTHEYDGDGRLVRVKEGERLWEEFTWSNSNDGSNYSRGKMVQAIRHNYPPPGLDWAVVEDYEYRGRLGKMSRRTTQLRFPDNAVDADRYAHTFEQGWEYDALGNVVSIDYPGCITTPQNNRQYCNDDADQQPLSHTVTRTYNQGVPVKISTNRGISADYQYHWNYQLKRIDYSNQAYTSLAQGTRGMQRPAGISHYAFGGQQIFASGTYQYDGAGNIAAIGEDRYVYDAASRLVRGTAGSANRWEAYTYDYKDNLTAVERDGGAPAVFNISAKNRLVGNAGSEPDTIYDASGNIDRVGPPENPLFDLEHDSLNMVSTVATQYPAPAEEYHAYGPGNYRLLTYNASTGERFWTLRDQDGKVLREHRVTGWGHYRNASQPGERWEFTKDHVYGPDGTLATRSGAGVLRFFHNDHLQSPRVITHVFGREVGRHTYYPYGGEAFSTGEDERVAKFTGHELDRHGASYYMLARTYVPIYYRFASVDPARDGWNLYGYANGNPIRYSDPTGLSADNPPVVSVPNAAGGVNIAALVGRGSLGADEDVGSPGLTPDQGRQLVEIAALILGMTSAHAAVASRLYKGAQVATRASAVGDFATMGGTGLGIGAFGERMADRFVPDNSMVVRVQERPASDFADSRPAVLRFAERQYRETNRAQGSRTPQGWRLNRERAAQKAGQKRRQIERTLRDKGLID
ncbi:MAG: RHS repeat-associated core domain-containing protein [Acidobacteriota bacterium]